jgi:hypothetical protein
VSGSGGDGSGWSELVRAGEVAPPTQAVLDRTTAAVREAAVREAELGAGRRPGRRRWVAPVAVAAAVAAAAFALVGRPGDEPVPTPSRPPMAAPAPPPAPAGPGANTEVSCAYSFDLRRQRFAFDGTVTAVRAGNWGIRGMSWVTFTVHGWFRGGRGPAASVLLVPSLPDVTGRQRPNLPSSLSYTVGTRLLVSGSFHPAPPTLMATGPYCGPYTRPYDPAAVAEWLSVFRPA